MVFDVNSGRQTELTQTRDDFGLRTDYELKFSGDMSFLAEERTMKLIQDMVEQYNHRARNWYPSERKIVLLDHNVSTGKMCVYLGDEKIVNELSVRDTYLFVSGLLTHQLREG